MSGPDVYEELIRRAARHINHCNEAEAHGAPLAAETARRLSENTMQIAKLVEFLRWLDAREEWPADGCECEIYVEWTAESRARMPEHCRPGTISRVSEYLIDRASVARWRYVLGPCSCSALADPAKEG